MIKTIFYLKRPITLCLKKPMKLCDTGAQQASQATCWRAWSSWRARSPHCSAASSSLRCTLIFLQTSFLFVTSITVIGGEGYVLRLETNIQVKLLNKVTIGHSCLLLAICQWRRPLAKHTNWRKWICFGNGLGSSYKFWWKVIDPCRNFSFMTECRADVNKLECGSSRRKVGQVICAKK